MQTSLIESQGDVEGLLLKSCSAEQRTEGSGVETVFAVRIYSFKSISSAKLGHGFHFKHLQTDATEKKWKTSQDICNQYCLVFLPFVM